MSRVNDYLYRYKRQVIGVTLLLIIVLLSIMLMIYTSQENKTISEASQVEGTRVYTDVPIPAPPGVPQIVYY